jgi:uncharacterized protein (DUF488 family)
VSPPARTLWTIGYEGFATPEELRDVLLLAGVERLFDVRRLPRSRRRGFSKRGLEAVMAEAGIVYEHRGDLGTPKEIRDLYHSGRLEEGRQAVRARLRAELPWAVDDLAVAVAERPTAILCLEDDPARCHRRVVAEELVARHPGVEVVDIRA